MLRKQALGVTEGCSESIAAAFASDGCTVIKGGSHIWTASARNADSTVLGIPAVDVRSVLRSGTPRGKKSLETIRASASIVRISGPAVDVGSHYHISHLVGLVVAGRGWLNVPRGKGRLLDKKGRRWVEVPLDPRQWRNAPNLGKQLNEEIGLRVNEGDIVVLPRGAYHVFRCAPGRKMEYIAFEFSDQQTDYQAHH